MWREDEEKSRAALDYLASRSLLSHEEGRYRLHDVTRAFAYARLDEANESELAALRHAHHYLLITRRADALYLDPKHGSTAGLALFDREREHVEAAWEWARTSQEKGATEVLNELPDAGAYVLSLRLLPRQHLRWLEAAVRASRRLGDRPGEGSHLGNLGNAYARLGDTSKAIEHYEKALIISREIGDRRGEGNRLGNLGLAHARMGHSERAREHISAALEIGRAIQDPRIVEVASRALRGLGAGGDVPDAPSRGS